jgi:hypothetical protein
LAAERRGINPVPYVESVGTPKAKGNPPFKGLYKMIRGDYFESLLTDFLKADFLQSAIKKGKGEL